MTLQPWACVVCGEEYLDPMQFVPFDRICRACAVAEKPYISQRDLGDEDDADVDLIPYELFVAW